MRLWRFKHNLFLLETQGLRSVRYQSDQGAIHPYDVIAVSILEGLREYEELL